MRKIAEIRKDIEAKIAFVKGIDASDAEATQKGLDELNALVKELEAAEQVEAAEKRVAEQKFNQLQQKAGRSFSMLKFMRELAEGKGLSGIEAEVAEMGREEYRRIGLEPQGQVIPTFALRSSAGQNYTTAADGGNLIEAMSAKYVEELKEKMVITKLGATVLTGLVGTLPVITTAQLTASWGAEGAQAQTTKTNFAKATMTPHRNFIQVAFSKDLLRQTSYDVEAKLVSMITDAHANLVEKAAINGSGQNNEPTGILNTTGIGSVAMGTNGGAITWPKVVELETVINGFNANRGKLGYLTNSKVWGAFKTVEKASGTARFLMENNILNGYPVEWSNFVPSNLTKGTAADKCSAVIFGNFQDLYVGQWGGVDVVVDPYTRAGYGDVVITLNAWNDALVAEPKSFAAIKDVLA